MRLCPGFEVRNKGRGGAGRTNKSGAMHKSGIMQRFFTHHVVVICATVSARPSSPLSRGHLSSSGVMNIEAMAAQADYSQALSHACTVAFTLALVAMVKELHKWLFADGGSERVAAKADVKKTEPHGPQKPKPKEVPGKHEAAASPEAADKEAPAKATATSPEPASKDALPPAQQDSKDAKPVSQGSDDPKKDVKPAAQPDLQGPTNAQAQTTPTYAGVLACRDAGVP